MDQVEKLKQDESADFQQIAFWISARLGDRRFPMELKRRMEIHSTDIEATLYTYIYTYLYIYVIYVYTIH